MAEARGRDNWAHTSSVLAMLANVNRDPKKTPAFQPADFDPYGPRHRKPARVDRKTGFELLKAVFVPDGTGGRKP
ncbi:MAG: hypothetical protein BIFFINMI_00632 [Phycisphaerae bacterium]|nr:hypothetical protein [Phycisphaerae bacterium]